jgi:hypothetical protein
MPKTFPVLFLIILIACKGKESGPISLSKEKELRIWTTEHLADSTDKLDSFRFIRLDTITQKVKYFSFVKKADDEIFDLVSKGQNIMDLYKNSLDIAMLYRDLSPALYVSYKHDVDKYKAELDENQETLRLLGKRTDSLMKLTAKADSIIPVAFQAVCLYQVRKKDQSVIKDTAFIFLNTDKNIIKSDDYYKD